MKQCGECKLSLPETEFSKNRARKEGLSWSCKNCNRKAYVRTKGYADWPQVKARRKKYSQDWLCRKSQSPEYKAHKAKYMAEWRRKNPERWKAIRAKSDAKKKAKNELS